MKWKRKGKTNMISIDDAELKVNEAKNVLAQAEEELRLARNEAYRRVTSRPCPECGHLISLNGMPNKEGETDSHSVECPNCERSWDIQITWNGGPALEPQITPLNGPGGAGASRTSPLASSLTTSCRISKITIRTWATVRQWFKNSIIKRSSWNKFAAWMPGSLMTFGTPTSASWNF